MRKKSKQTNGSRPAHEDKALKLGLEQNEKRMEVIV
jgi:hypothetical protein